MYPVMMNERRLQSLVLNSMKKFLNPRLNGFKEAIKQVIWRELN